MEHVLVELGRHPLRVVVRGFETSDVLDEVGTEQEVVVGAEHRRDVAQERRPGIGQQVADRATEERDEPAAAPGNVLEIEREVADDGLHVDAGILPLDRGGGIVQRLLADVERHEAREQSGVAHGVEQHPRLLRRARAELDQRVGAGPGNDLGCTLDEDLPLATRRVVLVEARDLLEQRGAAIVVEPLRRDVLRRAREPESRVFLERAHEASAASRTPPYIQRLAGGRSLGRARPGSEPGEVTRAPPRSVIWPLMNLPLYSPTAPAAGRKRG